MSKSNVISLIDAFNLYHAICDLGDNRLKRLNLNSLSNAFIKPTQEELITTYFFTAYPEWLTGAYRRHQIYVQALSQVNVTSIVGHFKEKPKQCKKCHTQWIAHEEKQSDVNLAGYLIHLAHINAYDKALIVTADSDLCAIIDLMTEHFPNKSIVILTPPGRYKIARELRNKTETIRIKKKHMANNLLPKILPNKLNGSVIKIPKKYLNK